MHDAGKQPGAERTVRQASPRDREMVCYWQQLKQHGSDDLRLNVSNEKLTVRHIQEVVEFFSEYQLSYNHRHILEFTLPLLKTLSEIISI